jgi:hypothetical protein
MSYASPMLPFTGYTMTLYFVLTSPLRCEWNTNPCIYIYIDIFISFQIISIRRGRRIRDRMVVGFTTACAISACHH